MVVPICNDIKSCSKSDNSRWGGAGGGAVVVGGAEVDGVAVGAATLAGWVVVGTAEAAVEAAGPVDADGPEPHEYPPPIVTARPLAAALAAGGVVVMDGTRPKPKPPVAVDGLPDDEGPDGVTPTLVNSNPLFPSVAVEGLPPDLATAAFGGVDRARSRLPICSSRVWLCISLRKVLALGDTASIASRMFGPGLGTVPTFNGGARFVRTTMSMSGGRRLLLVFDGASERNMDDDEDFSFAGSRFMNALY